MIVAASVTPNKTEFGPLLYAGRIDSAIPALSDLGYSGIELSLRTSSDVPRDRLFRLLDKHGLELVSIATGQSYIEDGYSLFSSDEGSRNGAVGRLRDHIDLAAERGAWVIVGGIRGKLSNKENTAHFEAGRRCHRPVH